MILNGNCYYYSVFSTSALSSLSPSSRDSVDPIAELLSQLSGVRRVASNSNSSTPTQLQQLQMQLQLERQQVNATRQQIERLPRRQTQSQTAVRETATNSDTGGTHTLMLKPAVAITQSSSTTLPTPTSPSNFLLAGLLEEFSFQNGTEDIRLDRSNFVQQLVISTMVQRQESSAEKQSSIFLGDGKSITSTLFTDFANKLGNITELESNIEISKVDNISKFNNFPKSVESTIEQNETITKLYR